VSDIAYIFEAINEGNHKHAFNEIYTALKKDPDRMALLEALAYGFMKIEQYPVAYHLLKYVYSRIGPAPETLNNLGMNAMSLASSSGDDKYLNEAEGIFKRGIGSIKKSHAPEVKAKLLENLALVSLHQNEAKIAEKLSREALESFESNGAHEFLAYSLLSQGRWEEGFIHYEFALGSKFRNPKPANGEPYWNGQPGSLYIRCEQGIGDSISYASVLNDAKKHNKITLECDERLGGLFKRSFPDIEIHATRFEEDPKWLKGREFDYHALIGSLCPYYRKKDEDFPRTAFLVPDPERVLQWKALLDTKPGLKVGIAWTGGLSNTFKRRRSHQLEAWLPILKTPGITWVSLEYNDCSEEIKMFHVKHGINIEYYPRATGKVDYDETAALVSSLDCVVSTTTATVHLCGALGKECHVIVPRKTRWFYVSDSQKHRWYDSLTLWRQQDKWPFERIAQVLKGKVGRSGVQECANDLSHAKRTESVPVAESSSQRGVVLPQRAAETWEARFLAAE
jgi:tetratricopeptide (TPR) repeat protein